MAEENDKEVLIPEVESEEERHILYKDLPPEEEDPQPAVDPAITPHRHEDDIKKYTAMVRNPDGTPILEKSDINTVDASGEEVQRVKEYDPAIVEDHLSKLSAQLHDLRLPIDEHIVRYEGVEIHAFVMDRKMAVVVGCLNTDKDEKIKERALRIETGVDEYLRVELIHIDWEEVANNDVVPLLIKLMVPLTEPIVDDAGRPL